MKPIKGCAWTPGRDATTRGIGFYLPLNEGGGQPYDAVRGVRGVVVTDPVQWTVHIVGPCLTFPTIGNTQRPQFTTRSANLSTTGRATVGILFRCPNTGLGARNIISRWGATGEDWKIEINSSSGTVVWTHRDSGGSGKTATSAGTNYDDNVWRWAFGGCDGANARLLLVDLDGRVLEDVVGSAATSIRTTALTISLGNSDSASSSDFGGDIALAVIWPQRWARRSELRDVVISPYGGFARPRSAMVPGTGVASYVLTAPDSAYAWLGPDAALLSQRRVSVGTESYALLGSTTTLLGHRVLMADPGSYAATGAFAGLVQGDEPVGGTDLPLIGVG